MANMLFSHKKQPCVKGKSRQTKKTLSKMMAVAMISTALSPVCMQGSGVYAKSESESKRSSFKFLYTTLEHDAALNKAKEKLGKLTASIGKIKNKNDLENYKNKAEDLQELMLAAKSYFLTRSKLDAYDNVYKKASEIIEEINEIIEKEEKDEQTRKKDQAELDTALSDAKDQMLQLENAFKNLRNEPNRILYGDKIKVLRELLLDTELCDSMNDKLSSYKKVCKGAILLIQKIDEAVKQEVEDAKKQAVKDAESLKKFQDERFENMKSDLVSTIVAKRDGIDECLKDFEQADSYTDIVNNLKSDAGNLISKLELLTLSDNLRSDDLDIYDKNLSKSFSKINDSINSWLCEVDEFSKDVENIKNELKQERINQAKDDLFNRLQDLELDIESKFSVDGLEEFEHKAIKRILGMKAKLSEKIESLRKFIDGSVVDFKTRDEAEKNFNLIKNEINRCEKAKTKIMNEVKKRRDHEELLASKHDLDRQLSWLKSGKLTLKQVVGGNEKIINHIKQLLEAHRYRLATGKGTPSKGMLLYGTPGGGKTLTIKSVLASENVKEYDLKRGINSGNMVNEINAVFAEANNLARNGEVCVIFIDEMDSIAERRDGGGSSRETVAILSQIDTIEPGVIVIGTTNMLSNIDSAVIREGRIEDCQEMTPLSDEGISKVIEIYLNGFKFENGLNLNEFVSKVMPYVRGSIPARAKRICERAVALNMKSKNIIAYSDVVLSINDIIKAL